MVEITNRSGSINWNRARTDAKVNGIKNRILIMNEEINDAPATTHQTPLKSSNQSILWCEKPVYESRRVARISLVDADAPIRSVLATLIKSESAKIDSVWFPHEDSFRTNSLIPLPDLTPWARIRGGPSTHDCSVPLIPATIPQTEAMIANHRPWPHSGSVSDSGSIRLQTKIDRAMNTPPTPETKFGARDECPIIERTCIIVAVNRIIPDIISIIVATYPALCQSAYSPHCSSFCEEVAPSCDSIQSS